MTYFQVWACQVAPGAVGVGDVLDFSRRLDNRTTVVTGSRPNVASPQPR